jgi:hypothetical protein
VPGPRGEEGLLSWQAITLPPEFPDDGLSGARIFVVKEGTRTVLYLFTRTGFVYQLSK